MKPLLIRACQDYDLSIDDCVQYDYWSDTLQTFMLCGTLDEEQDKLLVERDDLPKS